jgi:hypothetical protein
MSRRIHAPSRCSFCCAGSALLLAGGILPGDAQAVSPSGRPAGQEKPAPPAAPISLAVATNKKVYASGEPISFVLTVRAGGKQPVHVTYPSSQKYDFEIRRGAKGDGPSIWKWSQGRVFAAMLSGDTLEPGKPGTFTARYDLSGDRAGKPIPLTPGTYTVIGTLTILPQSPRHAAAATFRIK